MKDKMEQAFKEAPKGSEFEVFKAGAEWAQKHRTSFMVKELTDLYPSEVFGICFVFPAAIALVVLLLKLLF